jgi:hypothetical protein
MNPPSCTLNRLLLLSCLALAGTECCTPAADADAPKAPAYRADTAFFEMPEGLELAAVAGVTFGPAGEIIVTHRGSQPVLLFDAGTEIDGRRIQRFLPVEK